jgi:hypothetical protein
LPRETAFHRQHVQVPDLLHQFDGAVAFAIASSRLAGKFNRYRRSRIRVRQGLSRAHSQHQPQSFRCNRVGYSICGPMTGMEAILERHKNELRVVLKLEMIGRSVSVAVGAEAP